MSWKHTLDFLPHFGHTQGAVMKTGHTTGRTTEMARTATTGSVYSAKDTNRGYGLGHGVGKASFSWSPKTGVSGSAVKSMRSSKEMKAPKDQKGGGKMPTERTQFNKGLIVRGKKQLMG